MRYLIFLFTFISICYGCKILSLSGGGAHGAYQAGVIYKLSKSGYKWDLITGVSVGSLNAMFMSIFTESEQDKSVELMKQTWTNITQKDVYRWNWNPLYDQSLLDNSGLNKTIYRILEKNGGIAKRNVILGSTNLNTGELRLFNNKDLYNVNITHRIVMASSALPVVFPPVLLEENYYIDGGTFSNEIIRPGIKHCLDRGDSDISIDVIICSPPINYINNTYIKKSNIFHFISRAYDIMSNSVFNHELYSHCQSGEKTYPMRLFKPNKPYPGGLLDFNTKDLSKMFDIGYNSEFPKTSKYCY